MKDKILFLIIGILIGAIITAGVFLLISNNSNNFDRGQRPNFANFDANNLPEGFDPANRPEGKGSQNQVDVSDTDTTNTI